MALPKPLIDLDALTDRQQVRLGGQTFTLLSTDELSPIQGHKVGRLGKRMAELSSKAEDLTPDEEAELAAMPDAICALVVVAGDIATLDAIQRWQLARIFIQPRPELTAPILMAQPVVMAVATSTGAQ